MNEAFLAAEARVLARWRAAGVMPVLDFDGADLPPLPPPPDDDGPRGLYAICASPDAVARWAGAGLREIQLRIKSPDGDLIRKIEAALRAVEGTPARLWVNDHWREALACGARALHLGQEDLAAMRPDERAALRVSGAALGISSHSLLELARARGMAPSYIACGPVYATTTKVMPWRPQGLHNLAWWAAHAGRPVVAIGGLLTPAQVRGCAAAGAAAACLVRALDGPVPLVEFERAWEEGRRQPRPAPSMEPRPSLASL